MLDLGGICEVEIFTALSCSRIVNENHSMFVCFYTEGTHEAKKSIKEVRIPMLVIETCYLLRKQDVSLL